MDKGISVIIPTYNRQKFIAESIQSVLAQEYSGKIEIIISDDGSKDNTIPIAFSFGEKVKIVLKPNNCLTQGVSSTRNRGIAAASQPFISFLDSDDFYLPNHFKRMIKVFRKNPKIGFVFCRILECREENGKRMFRQWTHPKVFKKDIKNPVVSRSHIVNTDSFIFRREVFERAGVFNEEYSNGEDGDLWMRISELYDGTFSDHFGAVYNTYHGEMRLTKNLEEIVRRNYLIIFKNAIQRYKQLKLKDTFRIFKLKHNLLFNLYKDKKSKYYFEYIILILRYPISVIYIIQDYYYSNQKSKQNNFKEINYFLK